MAVKVSETPTVFVRRYEAGLAVYQRTGGSRDESLLTKGRRLLRAAELPIPEDMEGDDVSLSSGSSPSRSEFQSPAREGPAAREGRTARGGPAVPLFPSARAAHFQIGTPSAPSAQAFGGFEQPSSFAHFRCGSAGERAQRGSPARSKESRRGQGSKSKGARTACSQKGAGIHLQDHAASRLPDLRRQRHGCRCSHGRFRGLVQLGKPSRWSFRP